MAGAICSMRGMRSWSWSFLLVSCSIVMPLCIRVILLVAAGMAEEVRMETEVAMGFLNHRKLMVL